MKIILTLTAITAAYFTGYHYGYKDCQADDLETARAEEEFSEAYERLTTQKAF